MPKVTALAGARRSLRIPRRVRRWVLRAVDVVLMEGVAARCSYHLGLHGTLRVTSHDVTVDASLPRPLRLAFASDFHAGPVTHPLMFGRLVDEIVRQQPDVLLLGGDYVSSKAQHIEPLVAYLARCAPPLGKYAVLGNHDQWTGREHIVQQLQQAGVQVLINHNVPLPAPFGQISVCGIDDLWSGRVDGVSAFAGAGPVRIFLSHSPDGLCRVRGMRFDIGLAGHTHGGQIAFADGTPLVSIGGPLSRQYSRGRFEVEGGGTLIVSRGVGCSNLPLRINSDPELILCTMRAGSAGTSG